MFDFLSISKLPSANEFQQEINKESKKQVSKSTMVGAITFWLLFRFKKVSIINKVFLGGSNFYFN